MSYTELDKYIFDCSVCPTRCDGKSKGVYRFENDVFFSEKYEQIIINRINTSPYFNAQKCENTGYPDIAVYDKEGKLHNYVEVKVQQRTFMKVQSVLPASGLFPSETIALNLSDFLRYYELFQQTGIPVSIVWVLLERPCITMNKPYLFFYQRIEELWKVYLQSEDKRRFRRKSGVGDVVEGTHKGVTVNYHFSLKELLIWEF